MKRKFEILFVGLFVASGVPALAGGGSAGFKEQGMPLLDQCPLLAQMITSRLSIDEVGEMGPMDAPFDGARLYTFLEFHGHSTSPAQEFTLRIHFKSTSEMTLKRIEIIPGKMKLKGP